MQLLIHKTLHWLNMSRQSVLPPISNINSEVIQVIIDALLKTTRETFRPHRRVIATSKIFVVWQSLALFIRRCLRHHCVAIVNFFAMMVGSSRIGYARSPRYYGCAGWQMYYDITVMGNSEANWDQFVVSQGILVVPDSGLAKCVHEQLGFGRATVM